MSAPLIEQGVAAIAEAIADGATTSERVTQAALDRLASRGARFNAVATLERERALEMARAADLARAGGAPLSPLHGVPMAHKDLFYRPGRVAACGSRIRRGWKARTLSAALARLDAAGAVDCGTLHMAEFALSPTGYNEHDGHGLNPWSAAHCPGGSSSGSGAAVAAGCIPAALGSDTGGSIRHPAAMCGLTGLKPTHGAVSLYGAMPLSRTLDCIGPLARRARDVSRLHDAIAGYDPADPTTAGAPQGRCESALSGDIAGARISAPQGYYADALDPEVAAAIEEARGTLVDLGADVFNAPAPDIGRLNALAHVVMTVEAATLHRRWLTDRPNDYATQVRARIEPGLYYPATRYVEALAMRGPLSGEWLDVALAGADCALVATLPVTVPTIAETTEGAPEAVAEKIALVGRHTRAINYLGLPAVAAPCGFSRGGLPISFMLVGRPWSEPLLLRIADAYQRVTDWHARLPVLAD